tara:strand:- start:370 stop:888 length:519 start_codon:yes stop_codon:yes gene_type:complete
MLKEFIRESAIATHWTVDAFDGAIKLRGRILSPAEAESAGITSGLLAAEMHVKRRTAGHGIEELAKKIEEEGDNLSDETIDQMLEKMKMIRPETLLSLAESQDRVITTCVKSASMDGETWEPLRFCTGEDQQDPEAGILWIGVLSSADRSAILDKAMKGHKEAASRLASFRS